MAALQEGKCAQALGEVINELVVLSLLYLKVFHDYPSVTDKSSTLLTTLPVPVFRYGLAVGREFCISIANPADLLPDNVGSPAGGATAATVTDVRRGTCRRGQGSGSGNDFDGPMAAPDNALESCGEGARCCRRVHSGGGGCWQLSGASAMEMEVQIKAVSAGVSASLAVEEGGKVIEGALIVTLKQTR